MIAIALSAIVCLGFLLFALDEVGAASRKQGDKITESERVDPTREGERARERRNGAVRELIDDANDVLLSPFAGIGDASNKWVHRGLPALLALLVYGVGLGFLSRFGRGRPGSLRGGR